MQTIDFITCTQLDCVNVSQAPVVLCIDPAVSLVSGHHTLSATLVVATFIPGDCVQSAYWRYTLSYDEALLTDPETLLTPVQITQIFCESCFTDWIRELIAIATA